MAACGFRHAINTWIPALELLPRRRRIVPRSGATANLRNWWNWRRWSSCQSTTQLEKAAAAAASSNGGDRREVITYLHSRRRQGLTGSSRKTTTIPGAELSSRAPTRFMLALCRRRRMNERLNWCPRRSPSSPKKEGQLQTQSARERMSCLVAHMSRGVFLSIFGTLPPKTRRREIPVLLRWVGRREQRAGSFKTPHHHIPQDITLHNSAFCTRPLIFGW